MRLEAYKNLLVTNHLKSLQWATVTQRSPYKNENFPEIKVLILI